MIRIYSKKQLVEGELIHKDKIYVSIEDIPQEKLQGISATDNSSARNQFTLRIFETSKKRTSCMAIESSTHGHDSMVFIH